MVHDPAKKKLRFSKCFIAKNAIFVLLCLSFAPGKIRYFLVSLSFDVELFIFPRTRCCFIYKYQRVDDRWAKCWHYIWLFISFEKQPRFNLKSIAFDKFLDVSDISLHNSIFDFCKKSRYGGFLCVSEGEWGGSISMLPSTRLLRPPPSAPRNRG